jgi:hypothetical protein
VTVSTACPSVRDLRSTIERHILDLYDAGGALRPETAWPGYYTLPSGVRRPAVYVVGAQMVPSDWRVTGIETTIQDVPEDVSSPGGSVISFEKWLVRFTNYGTRDGTTMPISMLDIRRRVARAFPQDSTTYMARTEATYESLTARILGAVLNPPIPS